MSKLVNGTNSFNIESLNDMIYLLESGEEIGIYIDCIGHTRNYIETNRYVNALHEVFGDKLDVDNESTWYPLYKLKGE